MMNPGVPSEGSYNGRPVGTPTTVDSNGDISAKRYVNPGTPTNANIPLMDILKGKWGNAYPEPNSMTYVPDPSSSNGYRAIPIAKKNLVTNMPLNYDQSSKMAQAKAEGATAGSPGTALLQDNGTAQVITNPDGSPAKERIIQLQDKETMRGVKEDQYNNRQVSDMVKYIDPTNQVRSALGVAANGLFRAERLKALSTAMPDLNDLKQPQVEEIAIGLNSIMQGSNQAAIEQVRGLLPNSIWGDTQKALTWITNNPRGLEQGKFVKVLADTIERENIVMKNQINRTVMQRLSAYPHVEKNSPQEWDTAVRSFNIDPEEYRKARDNGFKDMPSVIPGHDNGATDEIIKQGTDDKGRKVGMTKSGKTIYIQ